MEGDNALEYRRPNGDEGWRCKKCFYEAKRRSYRRSHPRILRVNRKQLDHLNTPFLFMFDGSRLVQDNDAERVSRRAMIPREKDTMPCGETLEVDYIDYTNHIKICPACQAYFSDNPNRFGF